MARVTATATAVANLSAVSIKPTAGLTVATSDDLDFSNNGDVWLVIHNADASSHTATIKAQGSSDGVSYSDHTETIAAGDTVVVGAYNKGALNTGGKVQIDWESGEEEHLYYKLLKFTPLS